MWPGRDQDDHRGDGHSPPGDDEEGDRNDPHRGSKRRAIQFWEFGWCCHPVGSYGGPQEVAHGEDLRSASASPFAKTEEYVSPSYLASPDVLVKEEPKGKVHLGGAIDPSSSTPTSPERLAAADAPLEPASAPVHAEAVEKDEASRPEVGHQPMLVST